MMLRTVLAENVLERDLQENVRVLAKMRGYLFYHTHRSRHSPAGFPDCVFIKNERIVVAELKREKAKLTADQQGWIDGFASCGIPAYVWRPSSWNSGEIDRVLC